MKTLAAFASRSVQALTVAVMLSGAAAGCSPHSTTNEESATNKASALNPIYGVDYSWARPDPNQLAGDGYQFAARYLSYTGVGKNLSAGEADALRAAGVDVVVVWEQNANDALQGYQRGVSDAQTADAQAHADGMPDGRPIYFAVDFDASPNDQGALDAYFDGVASVLGHDRTGAYGGYYVIQRLFDNGKINYGWQTYAWSGGQWDPRAQLRQIENGIPGDMDKDEAVAPDFGQWGAQVMTGPPTLGLPPGPSGCGALQPGEGLAQGTAVTSCDGRFTFTLQTDGNLVLYQAGAGALWASGTNGTNTYALIMQGDGNLVLYSPYGAARWASGTDGHGGATLAVQDDGNVVIYDNGNPIWATNTDVGVAAPPPPPPPPPPAPGACGGLALGQSLGVNASVQSCDGRFDLVMQGDGNFVLYEGPTPLWASGTDGTDATVAVMQDDGNLVLYNGSGTPRWASGTDGHGGSSLAVQDDGNVVIYENGNPIWASNTAGH